MSKILVTPATLAHSANLAPNLRKVDVEEIRASTGREPDVALPFSISLSPYSLAALDDEGVVAIWGIGAPSVVSSIGHPWMVGTDRMATKHRRRFYVETQKFLLYAKHCYDVLVNYVDARNEISVAWLSRIGFTIFPAEPFGVLGLPFHKFEWRRN